MPMTATTTKDYRSEIQNALNFRLNETRLDCGSKYQGKVRDTYELGDKLILVTTDRLSAFDRHLTSVPFKGQVLNLTSAWWFEKTEHIVPNHVLAIPDPNVTLAKKCKVFPIEFVVRGYITGTTSTSLWTQYNNGVRNYCGHQIPEGLRKNQRLKEALLTPTTKDVHDRPISPREIIEEGFMTASEWEEAAAIALKLYHFGAEQAAKHGLILVDTKYELGKDENDKLILVDEIHTPDSSRYWLAPSYEERFALQQEPENIDKEFLRLWFAKNCDPYKDATLPQAPDDLVVTLASRYIQLYEMITGTAFRFPDLNSAIENRIAANLRSYIL
jgi:phosphoribosylaminoimidazole-succinocarboxamide synthase